MSKNSRNYPKNNDENKNELVKKLKTQIKNLQKENNILKSENKTLLDAWTKTEDYLQEITNGVPLEDLLKFRKFPKKAVQMIDKERPSKTDEEERERVREKWLKWRKENLK